MDAVEHGERGQIAEELDVLVQRHLDGELGPWELRDAIEEWGWGLYLRVPNDDS